MQPTYIIRWRGEKPGTHEYKFEVRDELWREYPEGGVLRGRVEVRVEAEVKGEREVRLEVEVEGRVVVECDRCLDECELPTAYKDEVVVPYEEGEVDLKQHIYESIILGLPILRVHEDRAQCNPEMIKRINTD